MHIGVNAHHIVGCYDQMTFLAKGIARDGQYRRVPQQHGEAKMCPHGLATKDALVNCGANLAPRLVDESHPELPSDRHALLDHEEEGGRLASGGNASERGESHALLPAGKASSGELGYIPPPVIDGKALWRQGKGQNLIKVPALIWSIPSLRSSSRTRNNHFCWLSISHKCFLLLKSHLATELNIA